MFLLSNCGASTVTTRKVECHLARAMNEKLEHDEWNLLIVAALFNPKTPTQNVYVIRTHAHTIACGKLQMIHSIALAWYSLSSSCSLTYVSMQLSFAKCYIAIHVDVCKQSSQQAQRVNKLGKAYGKKLCTHTYLHRKYAKQYVEQYCWSQFAMHSCSMWFCFLSTVLTCFSFVCECRVCLRVRHFTIEIPHNMGQKFFFVLRAFCKH